MNNLIGEPQAKWGGKWTDEKLNAFEKYVAAYLQIMNKHQYWETIYFDGFAGSGDRTEECNQQLSIDLGLVEEDQTYKGAAERVVSLASKAKFNYYYFIDKKKESLTKLQYLIDQMPERQGLTIEYRCADANEQLHKLGTAMKANAKLAALVFLDPFGMQINWNSIEHLAETRSDVWILVPTGVIINRLLNRKGEINHKIKLESFFGLPENEIKERFYTKESYTDLFGDNELVHKVNEPIEKIAALYVERLKTIWKHVTDRPLVLKNRRGVPIYHFIFASNNQTAVKIAAQIVV